MSRDLTARYRAFHEAWRKPLPYRGPGATLATLGTGAIAVAVVQFVSDASLQARIALSGIGIVMFMIGVARPRFAWRFDRGWRSAFGDRGYAAIYIASGLAVIVVAWVAPL